ncbi:hypothetical protein BH11VER1_BH11VER1_25310 [soil metagenome]
MRAFIIALSLVFFGSASAQWKLDSQSEPVSLGHSARQVMKKVSGPMSTRLNMIFFDSTQCALRIVDRPQKDDALSLAKTLSGTEAIAGCNGGYFTPEFQPLGLVVSQGKRAGVFERSSLLGGVFLVRKGKPMLLWRDEFTEVSGITELLQAGPRLVNGGKSVTGLEALRRRPRTVLLTDNNGHWAIGSSGWVSLREISDILATPGIITEFTVERALNLDGGSSCGLWWKDATGREHSAHESATVRNFLVIVPKP